MIGSCINQVGGLGKPCLNDCRVISIKSEILSAKPTPKMANGNIKTITTINSMIALASVFFPFNNCSKNRYSGQVEKDKIIAHSMAEKKGRNIKKQPVINKPIITIATNLFILFSVSIVSQVIKEVRKRRLFDNMK